MDLRELGKSGLHIAPLMLGGNVFGWTADRAASFAVLDAFVDAGFNAIDTADVYSAWVPGHEGGESERVLGDWLNARGLRDKVVIATKVGMWPRQPGLTAANIVTAVEASLKRLQTDYIDLYQSHRDDDGVPQDETARAFGDLIMSGKVRAIGASNFAADRLASAQTAAGLAGVPRYETLQPEYNLVDRSAFEGELAAFCQRESVGVIPYYGLASGFLTGKYRSSADLGKSPRGRGMVKYLEGRGLQVLAAVDQVALETGATAAQVSLAWLMVKVTAPIASATSVTQLLELAGAARLTLSPDQISTLDGAGSV